MSEEGAIRAVAEAITMLARAHAFDSVRRSPECCGCPAFPYALCPPCHRLNYPVPESP